MVRLSLLVLVVSVSLFAIQVEQLLSRVWATTVANT